MLVTFKTSAYADITMFGQSAVSLLKLMGQSGHVPGAILAADIPQALKTLHEGLARLEAEEMNPGGTADAAANPDNADDDEVPVPMHTRAGPLIELLQAASAAGENVMWDN